MGNINNINFEKYANISLTVEKVEDTQFDGKHPNGYNPGFKIEGCSINVRSSNYYCCLFVTYGDRWFHTSEVQKQEKHEGYDLLYTLNSVYKVIPNFVAMTGVQEKHSLKLEEEQEDCCPNCGECENIHVNYDWGKKDRPIENFLCNECHTYFKPKQDDNTNLVEE